jgi:ATP-dependent helicase/nuclease subunit A
MLGIGVHTLLEDLVQRGLSSDTVSESTVRSHLEAAQEKMKNAGGDPSEITSEIVDTSLAMANRFLSSSLAAHVRDADRVFAEYPLSSVDSGDVVDIRRGVIDLVYEDEAGWHIVDYKTDRVGENGLPDSLGDHKYTDQVQQYVNTWEEVSGEEVESASLWFADTKDTVEVIS